MCGIAVPSHSARLSSREQILFVSERGLILEKKKAVNVATVDHTFVQAPPPTNHACLTLGGVAHVGIRG